MWSTTTCEVTNMECSQHCLKNLQIAHFDAIYRADKCQEEQNDPFYYIFSWPLHNLFNNCDAFKLWLKEVANANHHTLHNSDLWMESFTNLWIQVGSHIFVFWISFQLLFYNLGCKIFAIKAKSHTKSKYLSSLLLHLSVPHNLLICSGLFTLQII